MREPLRMTHDEMISVIQAEKDGESIQWRRKGDQGWFTAAVPTWNFENFEYRVKPDDPFEEWWSESTRPNIPVEVARLIWTVAWNKAKEDNT